MMVNKAGASFEPVFPQESPSAGDATPEPAHHLTPASPPPDGPAEKIQDPFHAEENEDHETLFDPGDRPHSSASTWIVTVLTGVIFALIGIALGYMQGRMDTSSSRSAAENQKNVPLAGRTELTAETLASFDKALASLQSGAPLLALKQLETLNQENPGHPDIELFLARAALAAGDDRRAISVLQGLSDRSQRPGDVYSLQASLLSRKLPDLAPVAARETEKEIERLLRRAVAVDLLNASARMELAAFLRWRGQSQEAREVLQSARWRLAGLDSLIAIDSALALIDAETQPSLVFDPREGDGVPQLMAAAVRYFMEGDPGKASACLHRAERLLPPETYAYLLGDPALRRFLNQPANAIPPAKNDKASTPE